MKKKIIGVLSLALMLSGCLQKPNNPSTVPSNESITSITSASLSGGNSNASTGASNTSKIINKTTSTTIINNSTTNGGGAGGGSSFSNPSIIIDPDTGEEIDLNGYVAYATAPEGVVLTDWTEEMSAIFFLYLYQQIPPFMWMPGLTVSMDNMGILQVKGRASGGEAQRYCEILTKNGYAAYYDDSNGRRTYGRGMGNGFMISVDVLEANGLCTINFDFDIAKTTWPNDEIAQVLSDEMYGGTKTTVPAYNYQDAQYYTSGYTGFGNYGILCLGAPRTAPEEYKAVLENEHWTVEDDGQGLYSAISRDKLIVLSFYFDGTGLYIEMAFGPGEVYNNWDSCVSAINDFGRTELRLTKDIAGEVLPVDDAEYYEIDRSTRGALQIEAVRDRDYKQEDLYKYATAMQATGKFTVDIKGDDWWVVANDHSYTIRLTLGEYATDTVQVTTLNIGFYDYRIYEGQYVYYGTWPTLQINTILRNIGGDVVVPEYVNEDATLYVDSSYNLTISIDIYYGGNNVMSDYKKLLTDYSWTIQNETATSYEAVDRTETAIIKVSKNADGGVNIFLNKYIKPVIQNGSAKFDFTTKSNISNQDTYFQNVTWTSGNVTFKVDQNGSGTAVGNYGDYLHNPLRIYKGQKITISTTSGKINKLEFFVSSASIKDFTNDYLSNITIPGATFESYNSATGMVRFNVNPSAETIEFTVPSYYSYRGFAITGLDVYYA